MRHILSVLVNDKPGVVTRVSSLFTKRGYNIQSFVGCESHKKGTSTLIITVSGDDSIIEQIVKQLKKIVDVLDVSDVTTKKYVSREMVLIKVKSDEQTKSELVQIADVFRANIVDHENNYMMVEATGDGDKIDALVETLGSFGILELVKSGQIAMTRNYI